MSDIPDRFRWLGAPVHHARNYFGWTQGDLAERVGVSRPQIADIEAGRALPSLSVFTAIADELEVSADWMLVEEVP